jgi:hypothetical protein
LCAAFTLVNQCHRRGTLTLHNQALAQRSPGVNPALPGPDHHGARTASKISRLKGTRLVAPSAYTPEISLKFLMLSLRYRFHPQKYFYFLLDTLN